MAREIDYRLLTPAALEGCACAWDQKILPTEPEAAVLWDAWLELTKTDRQAQVRVWDNLLCSSMPQTDLRQWMVLDNVRALLTRYSEGILARERTGIQLALRWVKQPTEQNLTLCKNYGSMGQDGWQRTGDSFIPALAVIINQKGPTNSAAFLTMSRWDDYSGTPAQQRQNQSREFQEARTAETLARYRVRMLWTFRKILPDASKEPLVEVLKQLDAVPEMLPFPILTAAERRARYQSVGE